MFKKPLNLKLATFCMVFMPVVSSSVSADHYGQHYKTVVTEKQVYVFKKKLCLSYKHHRTRRHHHAHRCRYWNFNNYPIRHYQKRVRIHQSPLFRHQHHSHNTNTGRLIGAAIGGLLGSTIGSGSGKTAATIGGVIAGTIIGGNIGNTMDNADRLEAHHTLETGRLGQKVTWRNPDSGLVYTVQPTRTYQMNTGRYCREYTTWVRIKGNSTKVYGTACRLNNGEWKNFN